MSSVNLAANTICAGWVLNFKISLKDYRDTIIVTFGAVWIAIFAAIEEKERSLSDLIELYTRPVFIIYFLIYQIILCALIFAELYLRKRYRYFRSKLSDSESSPLMIQDTMLDLEDSLFKSNLNADSNNKTLNRDSFSVNIDDMPSNLAGNYDADTEILESRCYQNEYLISKKNSTIIKNNGTMSNSLKQNSDVVETTPLLSNGEFTNIQGRAQNSLTRSPFDNENNTKMQVESIRFAESSSSVTRADSEQLVSNFNVTNNDFVKNILKTENASGLLSGFISGLICSMSILFTKTSVELLSLTLKGDNQFRSPLSWFIVFSLVSAALGNLHSFHAGEQPNLLQPAQRHFAVSNTYGAVWPSRRLSRRCVTSKKTVPINSKTLIDLEICFPYLCLCFVYIFHAYYHPSLLVLETITPSPLISHTIRHFYNFYKINLKYKY
ncbi:hypothetical protein AYI70_g152 [Smittium culicis]|uniref:Uncharacterized protein n=1 Tax=Smittium culicis TaxID=133412 RepID=A0A1R1YHP5_9FUNG|nr:hypothetical protein AYI70_g152 [Smittium culicis]